MAARSPLTSPMRPVPVARRPASGSGRAIARQHRVGSATGSTSTRSPSASSSASPDGPDREHPVGGQHRRRLVERVHERQHVVPGRVALAGAARGRAPRGSAAPSRSGGGRRRWSAGWRPEPAQAASAPSPIAGPARPRRARTRHDPDAVARRRRPSSPRVGVARGEAVERGAVAPGVRLRRAARRATRFTPVALSSR